jgi:hypothetical protein
MEESKTASTADQKQRTDFLLKDYEIKVRYLSDHFQRMWTRFNFFVVIEAALIALIGRDFTAGSGELAWVIALTGGILSLVWYMFGAQDRWLVTDYRAQVAKAAKTAADEAGISDHQIKTGSTPVGEKSGESDELFKYRSPVEWVLRQTSITRLAAVFPMFAFVIWVVLFIVLVSISLG